MKPKVFQILRAYSLSRWTWSCECCPRQSHPLEFNQPAAFAAAHRHARSVLHQLRADWHARAAGDET